MKTVLAVILTPIFYLLAYVLVIILGVVYVATFPIPARYMQWYIKLCCRIILLACGQWVRVIGKPPNQDGRAYLYLVNHGSAFDAFMIGAMIPEHFGIVAAEYNFRLPLWGSIARRFGAIPVERSKLQEAIASMNQAEKILTDPVTANRRPLVIFPEGTRTLTGQLQPFKKGAFHIAKNTGAVIVPCGISGAFENYNRNTWLIKPGVITWVWGQPEYELACNYRYCSVEELADYFYRQVEKLCQNGKRNHQTTTG